MSQQLAIRVTMSARKRMSQAQSTGKALLLVILLAGASAAALAAATSVETDQQQQQQAGLLFDGTDQQQEQRAAAAAGPLRQLVGLSFARQARQTRSAATNQEKLSAVSQLANQLNQQQQSELDNDEQTFKRQLPARLDKTAEKAQLRLLIDAILRSGLINLAGFHEKQQQLTPNWQLDTIDGANNNLAQYNQANSASVGDFSPINLLNRLEQQGDYAASLDQQLAGGANGALSNNLQQLQADQRRQFQSAAMDKREYIKPCSFNAISCVRTPFRRLIEVNRGT